MELYNRGDRRRLYWQCDHCSEWYQPIFENWNADSFKPFCNHCGCLADPKRKRILNRAARWVPEGCQLSPEGELVGQRRGTRIASFWMEGPAAAYQTWPSLGQKLLDAEASYENTDSQETLKSVLNTDWARPYLHRTSANQRSSDSLMEKAEGFAKRVVPRKARFLTAAIDVQAGKHRRFVVQVHAWGVGKECWIVDRFNIAEDKGPNGDDEPRRVDPGSRPEDWDLLTRDVLNRSYRIEGHEDARMQIHLTAVDTGGEDGVTLNAYDWYRRLRRSGQQGRAMLIKGASTRTPHPIRETRPNNTGRKDRKTNVKGDVPLWMLGTDLLKDAIASMLAREEPGPNYLHIPDWLGRWWHDEMTYEIRRPDGKWEAPGKKPNEAFDLAAYNLAAFIKAGGERIKWNAPPAWAREPGHNPLVTMGNEQRSESSPSPAKRKRQPRYRFGSR
jgi:phage terminase large subunit GpA-like protein